MVSFRKIAKTVADSWKVIDPITKSYVSVVAAIIKNRHNEISTNLNKMRALEALQQAQPFHLPNGHACLPGSNIAKIGDQEKKLCMSNH